MIATDLKNDILLTAASIRSTVFANMSLTLTLTGTSSTLAVSYFPAIDLSEDDYELGLTDFESYNTIPNVTLSNNKFYYGDNDEEIVIPEGSYELSAIQLFKTYNFTISKNSAGEN
ncbi:PREDICTED: uncharacterized protein LOC106745432 [Dinoponera quadriceps]|uniref:Uncharacterized protein LOC106745432 n=1 Tax=Dinoponera quadriceps TaxID=609295 RepID=A0A6P3XDJ0_DINQU|nr:PREDICTED: uncharacterized protein LOC106745432 [Dinoponera quadriceps]